MLGQDPCVLCTVWAQNWRSMSVTNLLTSQWGTPMDCQTPSYNSFLPPDTFSASLELHECYKVKTIYYKSHHSSQKCQTQSLFSCDKTSGFLNHCSHKNLKAKTCLLQFHNLQLCTWNSIIWMLKRIPAGYPICQGESGTILLIHRSKQGIFLLIVRQSAKQI